MKLKAKKHSDKTTRFEFSGAQEGLVATVRYITPEHNREILADATKHGQVNWERFYRLRCEAMVPELDGLTSAIFDSLVELDEECERPQPNEDGSIEGTPELIWFLWQNAQADQFANLLTRASEQILNQIALEKKRTGAGSAG